jgi:signal transduction histidine kinase
MLQRHNLRLARLFWVVLVVSVMSLIVVAIPARFELLRTISANPVRNIGQLAAEDAQSLSQYGITMHGYALWNVAIELTGTGVYLFVSLVIFWQKRLTSLRLLYATALVLFGATLSPLVMAAAAAYPFLKAPLEMLDAVGAAAIFTTMLIFPDGQSRSPLVAVLIVLIWGYVLVGRFFVPSLLPPVGVADFDNPDSGTRWILTTLIFIVAGRIQWQRFRSTDDAAQRQQTVLILHIIASIVIMTVLIVLIPLTVVLLQPNHPGTMLMRLAFVTGITFGSTLFPIAIYLSIVRYRLWNIVIIVERTLVYASLTALVIGIYVLVIGVLSALFQTSGNLLISLIATGIVAVLFEPLKALLQNRITQLLFGDRDNPFQVILKLSERLERSVAPGTLLPGIAETIAHALKLRYVSIALKDGDRLKTNAVYGQPADSGRIIMLPLMYGQEMVGQMVIGQGMDDRVLDAAERQLLENIAQQTGIAAHAVQLSQSLQHSRQQIITAREEERRRLRRDLHDGLGPSLAAHTIKVGTAKLLLESDPQTAAAILTDLEIGLSDSLTDIRRLVYNLRPPALDQLGLLGALHDFIQQCNAKTHITLDAAEPLPPLSAAVEVAAYRIVQEAVTNVLRHANAAHCHVNIQLGTDLLISIQDNGVGISPDAKHGIGLKSMQERAEELGGRFTLESRAGYTVIAVCLPAVTGESQRS